MKYIVILFLLFLCACTITEEPTGELPYKLTVEQHILLLGEPLVFTVSSPEIERLELSVAGRGPAKKTRIDDVLKYEFPAPQAPGKKTLPITLKAGLRTASETVEYTVVSAQLELETDSVDIIVGETLSLELVLLVEGVEAEISVTHSDSLIVNLEDEVLRLSAVTPCVCDLSLIVEGGGRELVRTKISVTAITATKLSLTVNPTFLVMTPGETASAQVKVTKGASLRGEATDGVTVNVTNAGAVTVSVPGEQAPGSYPVTLTARFEEQTVSTQLLVIVRG